MCRCVPGVAVSTRGSLGERKRYYCKIKRDITRSLAGAVLIDISVACTLLVCDGAVCTMRWLGRWLGVRAYSGCCSVHTRLMGRSPSGTVISSEVELNPPCTGIWHCPTNYDISRRQPQSLKCAFRLETQRAG